MTPSDRRGARRHPCSQDTPLRVLPRPTFKTLNVRIRDVSTTGIALLTDEPVEVGTALALRWDFGEPTEHKTIMAQVVRLAHYDNKIMVGCRFDKPIADEDIQALLADAGEHQITREGARRLRRAVGLIARLCGIG
jgi:hypothetical protein